MKIWLTSFRKEPRKSINERMRGRRRKVRQVKCKHFSKCSQKANKQTLAKTKMQILFKWRRELGANKFALKVVERGQLSSWGAAGAKASGFSPSYIMLVEAARQLAPKNRTANNSNKQPWLALALNNGNENKRLQLPV